MGKGMARVLDSFSERRRWVLGKKNNLSKAHSPRTINWSTLSTAQRSMERAEAEAENVIRTISFLYSHNPDPLTEYSPGVVGIPPPEETDLGRK